MIENIELIGLENEMLELIKEKMDYDIILNMACNHELIKNNIDLLRSFGIKNIESLLLNRENIFFMETIDLQKKFNNYNIEALVNLINEDYTVIDEIL